MVYDIKNEFKEPQLSLKTHRRADEKYVGARFKQEWMGIEYIIVGINPEDEELFVTHSYNGPKCLRNKDLRWTQDSVDAYVQEHSNIHNLI